ncbi:HAMP domain-containing methyl-accepting chemotaxis protein [Halanaerobium salsuginis]|uniref:Methyl-accepting chemotaxis sensory transducer n=1 Tax=Halanaerobium salsuginis TaxID=29563 RepID=A0A1I4JEF8_9FIRM|nr:methyl-accepting chemotaxis protein [Halanaerobium salsuginis]SFL64924.1 methyl-accepting chemotaxis sensory transducer [Halanaerobium salsuginis]
MGPNLNYLLNADRDLQQAKVALMTAMDENNSNRLEELKNNFDENMQQTWDRFNKYTATEVLSANEAEWRSQFPALFQSFETITNSIWSNIQAGNYDQAYSLFEEEKNRFEAVRGNLNNIQELYMSSTTELHDESFAGIDNANRQLVLTVIIFVLIAILISFIIVFSVNKGIKAASQFVNKIAEGKINAQIDSKYLEKKDEIGQLTSDMDRMRTNILDLISKIADIASEVSAASEELSASSEEISASAEEVGKAVQEVASGAEEQSAQVDETKTSIDSLINEVKNIEDKSVQMNEQADQVISDLDTGNKSINNSIDQVRRVKNQTVTVTEQIHELGNLSEKIGDIVELINGISSQTNLLALNAAIEAARAGEAGRGFSVVADEIRQLAEESSTATEQIASLINQIQAGVQTTVSQVDETSTSVDNSVDVIKSTEASFIEINQAMDNLVTYIEEIAEESKRMDKNSDFVKASISEIAAVSQEASRNAESVAAASAEQSSSTREIVTASTDLAVMAEKLSNTVEKFEI